jgi:hypothetical protein
MPSARRTGSGPAAGALRARPGLLSGRERAGDVHAGAVHLRAEGDMKTLLIILGLAAVNLAVAMAIGKRLRAMSVPEANRT